MFKDPALGSDFFDREKISSILIKRVRAFREGYHQNIGLVGKPSVGKSSILHNFVLTTRHPDIIPIYIDVLKESFEDFVHRFMGMVMTGYFQSVGESIPFEADALIKAARRVLPLTTKKMALILRQLKNGKNSEVFSELFTLASVLSSESGKKIVMVIDEFSLFEHFPVRDPFVLFGNQITMLKDTMFIVSTSLVQGGYEIFNEKLTLLFGNFEIIKVKPFDFRTTQNFIRSRIEPYGISKDLMRFLIWLSDGYPYYLSVLLDRLSRRMVSGSADVITKPVILDVLEEVLFMSHGELSQYFLLRFSDLFPQKQAYVMNTLVSLALGKRKVKDIVAFTERSVDEVKKILARLVDDEVIDKNGSLYFINDPMVCVWLRFVYHLRRVSLRVNKRAIASEFKRQVGDQYEEFIAADKKELSVRVSELFMSFQNDVVGLSPLLSKLPAFSSISVVRKDGHAEICARAAHHEWLCIVADSILKEDDLSRILADLKKAKCRAHRRILVLPYGIEINAKLLAKESKMLMWSLKDLNYLFGLYNKPKCVIEDDEHTVVSGEMATINAAPTVSHDESAGMQS